MKPARILVGCESSGVVRRAFRARGQEAYSCDLLPAADDSPHHLQCDVLTVLDHGWDAAIFHPDCTYQTNSAAWAYKDPDFVRFPGVGYHQKVKPGTLVGAARREAREMSSAFVLKLWHADIPVVVIENPVGHLSKVLGAPTQIIQPNWFGDDASKATCLWIRGAKALVKTKQIEPRWVDGKPRWANQTDSGQNRLPPSDDRWQKRSETYPGIAAALADQIGRQLMRNAA